MGKPLSLDLRRRIVACVDAYVNLTSGLGSKLLSPDEAMTELIRQAGHRFYNANAVLTEALAAGARGAYWDILLRNRCTPSC